MSLFNTLNTLIFQGYKENITTNSFTLKESSKSAKCKEAKFIKTKRILVYKFDKKPKKHPEDKFPFLNDLPKVKSMCDFILFYEVEENRIFVILCNLKSDQAGNSNDQISAGRIFATFLTETAKRYNQITDIKVELKEILFASKVLYKGTTSRPPKKKTKQFVSNQAFCQECNIDILCQ